LEYFMIVFRNSVSILTGAFLLLVLFNISACDSMPGKTDDAEDSADDNGDDDDDNDDSTTGGTLALGEGLNQTVPKDLAVTSVTVKQSQESLQVGQIGVKQSLMQGEGEDYLSKVSKLQSVLTTTDISECADAIPMEFSLAQGNFGHATCFGPAVEFTYHPDTNESGSIGNGDFGMFWKYAEVEETSGEACSSRVVNNLMNNVASYSDTAIGMHAMVACAGRLKKMKLPEKGKSTSAMESLSDLSTEGKGFTITSASIERAEDNSDGFPVYVTKIAGSLTDVPRSITTNYEISVRHVPTADKNKSYKGVLQFKLDKLIDASQPGAISIAYEWGEDKLNYRYRQAPGADIFDTTNLEVKDGDGGSGWSEVIVNSDQFGFGKLAFVWTTFDSLVFNAETKKDGTGVAYFGHSPSSDIGKAGFNEIKGLRCYPVNPPPSGSETYSAFVQRQTLKINLDNGIWEPETSNFEYAPTTSCSWNSANDPSESATFMISNQDRPEASTELSFPLEHNLFSISDYSDSWSSPAPPSEFK
jgi:hypothetical protein